MVIHIDTNTHACTHVHTHTHTHTYMQVGVLFTHPTYDAMKPCPYFLNGDCKFSDQICKFSHGHTVSLSELRPFQEPDFRYVHSADLSRLSVEK